MILNINRVFCRFVSSEIIGGQIHGQGAKKRYCFIIVETTNGNYAAELYPGLYNRDIVEKCVEVISARLVEKKTISDCSSLRDALHIPFISGNGIYESCVNIVINALTPVLASISFGNNKHTKYYYSGGTVKSSIAELQSEVKFTAENNFAFYKIRLDYRNTSDAIKKINFLNKQNVNYAVDFIVNTNISSFSRKTLIDLISLMDPARVIWIEEPLVPSQIHRNMEFLHKINDLGFKIAFGESFTSETELYFANASKGIDILQLDATINTDISSLLNFVCNSNIELAFHNWGSAYTTYINSFVASHTQRQCYFEVPFYDTLFDRELKRFLKDIQTNNFLSKGLSNQLSEIIDVFSDDSVGDFKWE